jgi:DHA1 family multidrug resistance protein-like MFS transporter
MEGARSLHSLLLQCDGYHTMKAIIHTSATRQAAQGRRVLLTNSALMMFGWYTVIAVFALHFTNDLRFTVAAVGLALALRQLTQQGLDIFGGIFGDRVGYRTAITLGCWVRVLGFVGMGFAQTTPQLFLAAFIAGFGGMFFDATGSAALAVCTAPEGRARIFSLQATLGNIAAALGPLVGVTLYKAYGFRAVAFFAAAIFIWIGLETLLWLPADIGRASAATPQARPLSFPQVIRAILLRRAYVRLILLLIGFWALNGQITLTVPLVAERLGGKNGVAVILGLNAFLAIPLQYPLVRWLERRMRSTRVLALSVLLSGLGLALIFLAPTFAWQLVGMGVATIGSLAISPVTSAITAHVAPPRAAGAFYGFSALAIGLGGIGQIAGGAIFDVQRVHHLPWLMAACVAAVTLGVAFALARAPSPIATPAYDPAPMNDIADDIASQSGIMPAPVR